MMLDTFKSIPITLDLITKKPPSNIEINGDNVHGAVIDLTITDGGKQANMSENALVWLRWWNRRCGNQGIRQLTPVNPEKGKYSCEFPEKAGHLGTVEYYFSITDPAHSLFVSSLPATITVRGIAVNGIEQDTCDDWSALQTAMGGLNDVLDEAIERMEAQEALDSAQRDEFERRYSKAEEARTTTFNNMEFSRQSLFEAHEAQRDRIVAAGEARRDQAAMEAEEARRTIFDNTLDQLDREALATRQMVDNLTAFVSRVHMVYYANGTTLAVPYPWMTVDDTTVTLEHSSVSGTTLVLSNPGTTVELVTERVDDVESKVENVANQIVDLTS